MKRAYKAGMSKQNEITETAHHVYAILLDLTVPLAIVIVMAMTILNSL